jgi:hypothetical protein
VDQPGPDPGLPNVTFQKPTVLHTGNQTAPMYGNSRRDPYLGPYRARSSRVNLTIIQLRPYSPVLCSRRLPFPRADVIHIGGSARGYQGFLAPSAISSAAGQTSGSTVYLCSTAVDANARFCRGQGRTLRIQQNHGRAPWSVAARELLPAEDGG